MKHILLATKGMMLLLIAFLSFSAFTDPTLDPTNMMAMPAVIVAGNLAKASYGKLIDSGMITKGQQLTEGFLRVEINLENGIRTYRMKLLASTGSGDRPLERKLEVDDTFYMAAIGMGVQDATDANGTNQANNDLLRSPNLVAAASKASITALYNGSLSFKVGQTEVYDRIPTSLLRFDTPASTLHGASLEECGFHFISPGYAFDGRSDNQVDISLPSNCDISALKGANQHVLVLELYGWLAKGITGRQGVTC